jgi:hypothetical protein
VSHPPFIMGTMKNQLVLISEDPVENPAPPQGTRPARSAAARRRAERSHARADRAREALREASRRATEREAARRRAREEALLAAAAQPRLTGTDSPRVPPSGHGARRRAA